MEPGLGILPELRTGKSVTPSDVYSGMGRKVVVVVILGISYTSTVFAS